RPAVARDLDPRPSDWASRGPGSGPARPRRHARRVLPADGPISPADAAETTVCAVHPHSLRGAGVGTGAGSVRRALRSVLRPLPAVAPPQAPARGHRTPAP